VLTRLRVQGFKNLLDVDVRFGAFTCVAGPNGVGKSNLFDAIRFLSLLTKHPIMEAVQLLRETKGRSPEPGSLFTAFHGFRAPEIRFHVEMIVDREVQDEFGNSAKASISTLSYDLAFRLSSDEGTDRLELVREELKPIKVIDARRELGFPSSPDFRETALTGVRRGGTWQALASFGSTGASTYQDTGLSEATRYDYRLRRTNAAGTSGYSDIAGTYTLPAAPSGLTAAKSAGDSSSRVDLRWTNNSSRATSVVVQASTYGGDWREFAVLPPTTASYTVTDLANGTTYAFRVVARNESGDSDPSTTASVTTDYWTLEHEATQAGLAVNMGVVGRLETDSQPAGVHGGWVELAPASSYTINFNYNLSTWDSYNQAVDGHTGYWDSFSVSVTDQPYSKLALTDPVPFPFYWGGSSYDDGVLETNNGSSTITVTGDPTKSKFLNLVLDTNTTSEADGIYPSYGTFTITSPTSLPTRPLVEVRATRPDAAEGGSVNARGQFTVYRDGGDASKDLVVHYTVGNAAGDATPGSDYESLAGTVTIPAGQRSATIDVIGKTDTDANEQPEPVTINITGDSAYRVRPNTNTASVRILNRKSYMYSFYGFLGPNTYGDQWIDLLLRDASSRNGYDARTFTENRGNEALQNLMETLDINGDHRISNAEAESTNLRTLGYSFGGTQAVNFSRSLNRVGKRVVGWKLQAPVVIDRLVTIDPVQFLKMGPVTILPLKTMKGPVQSNVGAYFNYYQHRPGVSTLVNVDFQGKPLGPVFKLGAEPDGWGGLFIEGSHVDSAGPSSEVWIDSDAKDLFEDRDREVGGGTGDPMVGGGDPIWRLYGNDVNHLTAVFFAYKRARDALV
jgi:hypothetical protein